MKKKAIVMCVVLLVPGIHAESGKRKSVFTAEAMTVRPLWFKAAKWSLRPSLVKYMVITIIANKYYVRPKWGHQIDIFWYDANHYDFPYSMHHPDEIVAYVLATWTLAAVAIGVYQYRRIKRIAA